MSRTNDQKIHQLFSPLLVPEKLTQKKKDILVALAEQVYPERDNLTISNEEKMKRILGVFYYKKALGKDLFKKLQQALKGKIFVKQELDTARKAITALKK